jgi:hypothetical protein
VIFFFLISIIPFWSYINDNSEEMVKQYVTALYLRNNKFIQNVSEYQLSDFSWLDQLSKESKYYSDTGPFYTEYWIWFNSGFVLYIDTGVRNGKLYVTRVEPGDRKMERKKSLKTLKIP